MNVTLLSSTPEALNLLLFSKQTRLTMSPEGMETIRQMPMEEKMKQLDYMLGTIQSSWEFVSFTFLLTGVTRAFTHQLVRHRIGVSFAQQAQRVVIQEGFRYLATGEKLNEEFLGRSTDRDASQRTFGAIDDPSDVYNWTMQQIDTGYQRLLSLDVDPQDARGVLPTNILTNIMMQVNLRALHEMMLKRLCVKAQGEFQDVAMRIREVVIDAEPWTEPFLRVGCAFSGVCIFPGVPVTDCAIKPHVFNPATGYAWDPERLPKTANEIQHLWQILPRQEIQPRVAPVEVPDRAPWEPKA